ncbi:putative MFS transporter [Aeropyrum pernix]|uniref:Putative MFS transporter n=1 Tax=Aeropyrum pernix TaxID=56636 RepID=A0A401HAS2_AERPX|nr:MFS transporter [Aeropyrum pernix]GBF09565.1 putative MFS transporter [Aeropyrum pernix]
MKSIGGVQAPLLILAALNGLSFGVIVTVLAPYMYSAGFSGTEWGLLTSTATVTSIIFTLLSGPLSDALGARRVVAAGYIVKAASFTLLAVPSTMFMAAGFTLSGVSMGISWSATTALVARSGRDEMLHRSFTFFMASNMVGGALGSLMGIIPPLLSSITSLTLLEAYRATILLVAPLSLLQAGIALAVREEVSAEGRASIGPGELLRGFREAVSDRRFRLLILFNMVIGLGASMSIHNIAYYFAAKYGVTSAEIGVVNALEQVSMAVVAVGASRIAERVGSTLKVYITLTSLSVPLLVAMTLVDSYMVAAAIYVVRTVLMNAANPLLEALTMRVVPRERRGSASSILSLSFTLPATAGRAMGGALLDINLELPLRLTAAIYALALAHLYMRRRFLEEGRAWGSRRVAGELLEEARAPQ